MSILIVEDNALVAMSAVSDLESAGLNVVGSAANSDQALAIVTESGAAAALVDIDLDYPGEGLELAKTLTTKFKVACAFMSGQAELARQNNGHALGLLGKPFTSQSLIAAARALVHYAKSGERAPAAAFEWFVAA